ncbi:exported hypothetical protein [Candidatus Sulfotelmatobacter kueseliae]|uniref:Uncharacterized protein n=1 Tax=Candidatus Sulfotelmatobacter kueseliae TaxID=2042962 RepID=A0A2U3K8C7_9BACT|nr:exported hypothetical protein [Candidatus Sulfotelmatobacter kueseliae]
MTAPLALASFLIPPVLARPVTPLNFPRDSRREDGNACETRIPLPPKLPSRHGTESYETETRG